ncbi:helix-turn-helix transcriptional regulator [Micrococcus terreus]|uniref:helix-turn-helix domain-containing protein n=1 Tax=Micrococcus terreus TaxID=574650 RepID=UPI0021A4616C|nr:helix-turn-helix transcriptional regulator [Micrococcus terreus]MCT2088381.1 helix-turn-helix transcriptional regulator [Micrococcus terreus]MDK7699940.1 helix-turn-helix transcriptional regulator [Micrococcus terreus]WOO98329.1 helix-turn-helix transcriptional regulator [Micrococcus terreus]
MKRHVEYTWRLRQVMAGRGMNNLSELIPHLHERGVSLSSSQIYRLLGGTPERMNLVLLGALLDVLDCSFEELCPTTVVATETRHRMTGSAAPTATTEAIRPVRARIHRPE